MRSGAPDDFVPNERGECPELILAKKLLEVAVTGRRVLAEYLRETNRNREADSG